MTYENYVRGLRMIEAHGYDVLRPCRTRSDWELAHNALHSLQGAVIGAGYNTFREAEERYRRARAVFKSLPRPCEATLYHVASRCDNVGQGGICDKCSETVKSVMHRTLHEYGITLG